MRKTLLIISVLFNIAFITIAAIKYRNSHQPHPFTSTFNYTNGETRQSVLSTLPLDSSDIVFVGNSITEGFPLNELFPNAPIKNRGISGNVTYQVVDRLPAIVAAHPKKIFLEMGVNDLYYSTPVDSILSNFRKAIAIVRTSPTVQLYIHSVTPTNYSYKGLNAAIIQLNDSLKLYCNCNHITYIDLYKDMVKNNALDTSLTVDGLHYNAKGYAIWEHEIKELIKH